TTRFVADFIGTTNLLSGTVEEVEDRAAIVRLDSGERCRVSRDGLGTGTSVDISIRPEAVEVSELEGDDPLAPRATVRQDAYLGSAVSYQTVTDGGVAIAVTSTRSRQRYAPGDAVRLAWAPTDALVLADPAHDLEETPR